MKRVRAENLLLTTAVLAAIIGPSSVLADPNVVVELCSSVIGQWNVLDPSTVCSATQAGPAMLGGHQNISGGKISCPTGFSVQGDTCEHNQSHQIVTGWIEIQIPPDSDFNAFAIDFENGSQTCASSCGCNLDLVVFTSTACTTWMPRGAPSVTSRHLAVFGWSSSEERCVLIGRSQAADDSGVVHLWKIWKSKLASG